MGRPALDLETGRSALDFQGRLVSGRPSLDFQGAWSQGDPRELVVDLWLIIEEFGIIRGRRSSQ